MKYKMLVMDMDDTLLQEDLTISSHVMNKLKQAEDKGVILVLASGRVPHAMHKYIEALDLNQKEGYAICTNGSYIIETHTYEIVDEKLIEKELASRLYESVKGYDLPIQVYIDDTIFVSFDNEYTNIDCSLTGLKKGIVDDVHKFIGENKITKFVVPGPPELLQDVKEKLIDEYGQEVGIFISKPYFLELMPKGGDKGHALEKLANKLNIAREEIIAVGDSHNDLGMIAYAGLGIAMKNALEEVKKEADMVIEYTNNEDAIGHIVDRYLL